MNAKNGMKKLFRVNCGFDHTDRKVAFISALRTFNKILINHIDGMEETAAEEARSVNAKLDLLETASEEELIDLLTQASIDVQVNVLNRNNQ